MCVEKAVYKQEVKAPWLKGFNEPRHCIKTFQSISLKNTRCYWPSDIYILYLKIRYVWADIPLWGYKIFPQNIEEQMFSNTLGPLKKYLEKQQKTLAELQFRIQACCVDF